MARPKTDQRIIDQISFAVMNDRKVSAGKILMKLRSWATSAEFHGALPSERQIARVKKRVLNQDQNSPGLQRYRAFSWPESMEDGSLPWEASHTCLELLHWHASEEPDTHCYPLTVVVARWFWRLTQAAPRAPVEVLYMMAGQMAELDLYREQEPQTEAIRAHCLDRLRRQEYALRYEPWLSKKYSDAYNKAIQEKEIPSYQAPLPFALMKERRIQVKPENLKRLEEFSQKEQTIPFSDWANGLVEAAPFEIYAWQKPGEILDYKVMTEKERNSLLRKVKESLRPYTGLSKKRKGAKRK